MIPTAFDVIDSGIKAINSYKKEYNRSPTILFVPYSWIEIVNSEAIWTVNKTIENTESRFLGIKYYRVLDNLDYIIAT